MIDWVSNVSGGGVLTSSTVPKSKPRKGTTMVSDTREKNTDRILNEIFRTA
ncbi:MAG: hypothetical protein BWY70_01633 [Bacteroidetes bacterium ADurb.Bin408]|nr:MAG: hypothetical protein BWY70_01633 [Bacteroidetes bacterium ADurb.Bin408]